MKVTSKKMKEMLTESHSWSDFDHFDEVFGKYLPNVGEGNTMASQISTAVCKLVYKWFNDGDVYDNSCYDGGGNDLSSFDDESVSARAIKLSFPSSKKSSATSPIILSRSTAISASSATPKFGGSPSSEKYGRMHFKKKLDIVEMSAPSRATT